MRIGRQVFDGLSRHHWLKSSVTRRSEDFTLLFGCRGKSGDAMEPDFHTAVCSCDGSQSVLIRIQHSMIFVGESCRVSRGLPRKAFRDLSLKAIAILLLRECENSRRRYAWQQANESLGSFVHGPGRRRQLKRAYRSVLLRQ